MERRHSSPNSASISAWYSEPNHQSSCSKFTYCAGTAPPLLGAIEAIISTLDVADSKVVSVALEAIDAILKTGESLNKLNGYISFVDEADGIDKIESLQEHENDGIYEKAIAIIEKYFGSDDGLEDENLAPAVSGDMFAFGVPTKSIDGSGGAASEQPKLQPFNFALDNAPTAVNFSFAP